MPSALCGSHFRLLSLLVMGIMNFIKEVSYNRFSGTRYYNSGRAVPAEELWTTRFLESRNIRGSLIHPINITSVFGPASRCRSDRRGLNIFYTGENIHSPLFSLYEDHLRDHHYDLTLGFDQPANKDQLRFPYWILHKFDPASDYAAVAKRVKELEASSQRQKELDLRSRFCCLVSRHDRGGQRALIADALAPLGQIDYAGAFRHSTDELITSFADDKISFMRQYRFNISPENSDTPGYVTEKLFDSFEAGCIPIYWGSSNNPEPELINSESIIFWTGDQNELQDRVRELMDPEAYKAFISAPVFKPGAAELIWHCFESLEKAIKDRL